MQGFPGGTSSKEPSRQCRRPRSCGFDSWACKIPGGGHGNSLQCSCLGNPVDRGAWRATVHGVHKEADTTERTQHRPPCLAPGFPATLPGQLKAEKHKKPCEHTAILDSPAPSCCSVCLGLCHFALIILPGPYL